MRQHYDQQRRFDCTPIAQLVLNCECRDEMIPVLAGLQHLYTCHALRHELVTLVAQDINEDTQRDVGRPGLDDWQIVVLAAVRLGCNFSMTSCKIKLRTITHCKPYWVSVNGRRSPRTSVHDVFAILSANLSRQPLQR